MALVYDFGDIHSRMLGELKKQPKPAPKVEEIEIKIAALKADYTCAHCGYTVHQTVNPPPRCNSCGSYGLMQARKAGNKIYVCDRCGFAQMWNIPPTHCKSCHCHPGLLREQLP